MHSQAGYGPDRVLWDGRVADLDNQFVSDGVYYYVFNKKIFPLTPVKLSFKQKYVVSPFSKSSLNRIK